MKEIVDALKAAEKDARKKVEEDPKTVWSLLPKFICENLRCGIETNLVCHNCRRCLSCCLCAPAGK